MRKLGIDLGDARIGLALSDPLGIIASGLETYKRKNLEQDLQHIVDIIKSNNVDTIVMGLPKNMDGTEGERVEKTKEFCAKLKEVTDVKIVFMDERLTTVCAEKMLIESNVRREDRKKVIDKVAACIILQSWLDSAN
ncbi:MAG: Holliday junction resolvase RuvX [Clostridia bacterium]|nr:Holliday junction resolvase RuvX [Clostridia bacterium]